MDGRAKGSSDGTVRLDMDGKFFFMVFLERKGERQGAQLEV